MGMWFNCKHVPASSHALLNQVVSSRKQRIDDPACISTYCLYKNTVRPHEDRNVSLSCVPKETSHLGTTGLTEDELQDLIRQGHAMNVIKLGRRGACQYVVEHIKKRWNTSKVAKLHCSGKPSNNMKQLAHDLEVATGGTVIFRSGGTILLLRHNE